MYYVHNHSVFEARTEIGKKVNDFLSTFNHRVINADTFVEIAAHVDNCIADINKGCGLDPDDTDAAVLSISVQEPLTITIRKSPVGADGSPRQYGYGRLSLSRIDLDIPFVEIPKQNNYVKD